MKPTAVMLTCDELYPTHNGGRRRMAALHEALAAVFDVRLVTPEAKGSPRGERQTSLERLARTATPLPRLGALANPGARERYRRACRGATFALVAENYLVPGLPDTGLPLVVDFPNLEVDRQRSLASEREGPRRWLASWEARKARFWEPAVARRAALCLCVSEADAGAVRSWGGNPIVAPNATDRCCSFEPSPAGGYALFIGDFHHEPNRRAVQRLLGEVWPLVVARRPGSTLVLAGRGSTGFPVPAALGDSVETRGFVESVHDCYRGAAVVVNLVDTGGGTQLKLPEAMAHGRAVVTTPYGAAQASVEGRDALRVSATPDGLATEVIHLLDHPHRRDDLGRRLYDAVTTWEEGLAPLRERLLDWYGETATVARGRRP